MNARREEAAFLVPRRTIRFVIALVLLTSGSALALVVYTHRGSLPVDLLALEIAAGLLLATIITVAIVPFRLHLLHRKLQRTLENLETGTLSAAENPLGSLGVAFQEHYRLLWRSSVLLRGSIEVHRTLIRNLVSLLDAGCVVLDGKGVVQYRSEAAAALGNDGDAFGAAVTPSISEIISVLAGGEQIESVTVAGAQYHCYPVFGPVLLRRNEDGGPLLQSRDGLAFVLLTDRPLTNAISRTHSVTGAGKAAKRGIFRSLEQLFSGGKAE
ncbi:MAG: hypothetical protein WD492_04725 [Alkalispirochaeta sp.]